MESAGSTPDAEQPLASTDVKISPALLRKLAKAGISPEAVAGTGPNGRIVKEDVDRVLAKGADVATGAELTQALTGSQQTGGSSVERRPIDGAYLSFTSTALHWQRIGASERAVPQRVGRANDTISQSTGPGVTAAPRTQTGSFKKTVFGQWVGLTLLSAVAREDGAVAAPVLTDVDQSSVTDLSTQLTALIGRARAGRLVAEDSQGAAITLSNLGMYEIDDFTAMVTPPQVMVLSVGQLRMQPVWDDETEHFMPQQQVTMVLGSDHRVVNGAQAAQFLQTVAAEVETAWSGEL